MGGWPHPFARAVPTLPPGSHCTLPRTFSAPDRQRQAEPLCLGGEVPRDQHNLGA